VSDSTLLPNRAGQAARRENRCKRIERAARKVDHAWDEWMQHGGERGEDFDAVVAAIGALRKALAS
jgi:hypothetical protein